MRVSQWGFSKGFGMLNELFFRSVSDSGVRVRQYDTHWTLLSFSKCHQGPSESPTVVYSQRPSPSKRCYIVRSLITPRALPLIAADRILEGSTIYRATNCLSPLSRHHAGTRLNHHDRHAERRRFCQEAPDLYKTW
jgi:hypothetical protein